MHHSEKKLSDKNHLVNVQFRGEFEWKIICYDLIPEGNRQLGQKRKKFNFCIPGNSGWIRGKPKEHITNILRDRLDQWGAGNLSPQILELINNRITEEA